jgi:DtxR family Mn-dependent transcriptional regulator
VSLTKDGRDYALKIIRAHRLYEKFLSEKTGYNKLDWHDMAEEMEHKLSHDDIDQLSSQLGSPHFDPHGDPIPTKTGDMIEERGMPLFDLPENAFGKIIHIEDEPEVVYKQILAEDLHIGSQVRIIESNKLRVKFYCEGEEYVLANEVAVNLTVIELSHEERHDTDVIRLASMKNDETGVVSGISKECRGANRRRLLDLGFVPGTKVSIGLVSPMKDPRAYRLRSTDIALRNEQANFILIKLED